MTVKTGKPSPASSKSSKNKITSTLVEKSRKRKNSSRKGVLKVRMPPEVKHTSESLIHTPTTSRSFNKTQVCKPLRFVWLDGSLVRSIGGGEATHGECRPWWPAKIMGEEAQNKLKVQPYGSTFAIISLDTTSELMKPFRGDVSAFTDFKKRGMTSSYRQEFNQALNLLYHDEDENMLDGDSDTDDSDMPPSIKQAMIFAKDPLLKHDGHRSSSASSPLYSPLPINLPNLGKEVLPALQKGMTVLATYIGNSFYHPAKVMDIRPTKRSSSKKESWEYRVLFWNNHRSWLPRSRIVSQNQKEFSLVPLYTEIHNDLQDDEEDDEEEFHDEMLASLLESLTEGLDAIAQGECPECWRFQEFKAGGRRRRMLSQQVRPGIFTKQQFYFISRYLRERYCPDSEDKKEKTGSLEQISLITLVLLPETVIRLIERMEMCSREQAEALMMDSDSCGKQWVYDILVKRELLQSS